MPTYLSPGVYVEEVEPARARSRGSAPPSPPSSVSPRGAVQHPDAGHQLEPVHPDVRGVRRGLLPRARGLRLLPERRRQLLRRPHRGRPGSSNGKAAPKELTAGPQAALGGYRVVASESRGRPAPAARSRVEVTDPAAEGAPRGSLQRWWSSGAARSWRRSTGVTTKRGKENVVTAVRERSKLITLEEPCRGAGQRQHAAEGHGRAAAGPPPAPATPRQLGRRRLRRRRRGAHRLRRPGGHRRGHHGGGARPDGRLPARRRSTWRRSRRCSSR